MEDKFRQTIMGAQNVATPASPLGNFPELANFYKSRFQLPQSELGAGALTASSAITSQNNRQAEQFARQKKIDELKDQAQMLKDYQDPKKWQQVQKEDGGYDFFDPAGQKVSLQQFAQVTKKQPNQILSQSQNNLDIQYKNDFKNLQTILNLHATGDQKGLETLYKKQPDLKNVLKTMKPDDLIRKFRDAYPNIYQTNNVNANPTGQVRQMGQGLFSSEKQEDNSIFGKLKRTIGGLF